MINHLLNGSKQCFRESYKKYVVSTYYLSKKNPGVLAGFRSFRLDRSLFPINLYV